MPLTLITGPIKSAKSLELIALTMPHEFANKKVAVLQPVVNVRDRHVRSRSGLEKRATKTKSLSVIQTDAHVIAIDEMHMFTSKKDIERVKQWLLEGKELIISGLDMDYSGEFMKPLLEILKLQPDIVIRKHSVCEVCQSMRGGYTQILKDKKVIKSGLPQVVPEDGTYAYRTVCRECFFNI